jgi:hypothetical protein
VALTTHTHQTPRLKKEKNCICKLKYNTKIKVKQSRYSGPEDSSKFWFTDFMTTVQDCGKFVSLTHRPHLLPGNVLIFVGAWGRVVVNALRY